jgi:Flp pilus assembly protein protease CpaA
MVYLSILITITLIGLIIASITDLKTREVPDWLSYGLIGIGIGLNLLFAIIYWNYWFIVNSLIGLLLFLIIAFIMFYAGQWGGGDSKVLMGLGALIGLDIRFTEFPFLISFFVNILVVGAVYGLLWSIFLVLKNFKSFVKEFRKVSHQSKMIKWRSYVIVFVFFMLFLFFLARGTVISTMFIALLIMVLTTFYLWIFVKAIEKTSMIKKVTPDKLTEGDWIAKDIKYNGKYICGPKDLGIEMKQIKELIKLYRLGKIKYVIIKEGIPFVPSFLIAYVITLFFGNLFFMFI